MNVSFNPGPNKLRVAKALKEGLHLGLKEARDMVNAKEFECTPKEYPEIKDALMAVGASNFLDITPTWC